MVIGYCIMDIYFFFEGELIDVVMNKLVIKVVCKGEGKELNNENLLMIFVMLKQVVDDMVMDVIMFDVYKIVK